MAKPITQHQINRLRLAYDVARNSPDRSTQNGAFIEHPYPVSEADRRDTASPNTLPIGVVFSPDRLERPAKYLYTEHAERGAIYRAARYGVRINGMTMYAAWAACADCARAIVCSGISTLVTHRPDDDGLDEEGRKRWHESIAVGDQIMYEGGVEIIPFTGKFGRIVIRRDGKLWEP